MGKTFLCQLLCQRTAPCSLVTIELNEGKFNLVRIRLIQMVQIQRHKVSSRVQTGDIPICLSLTVACHQAKDINVHWWQNRLLLLDRFPKYFVVHDVNGGEKFVLSRLHRRAAHFLSLSSLQTLKTTLTSIDLSRITFCPNKTRNHQPRMITFTAWNVASKAETVFNVALSLPSFYFTPCSITDNPPSKLNTHTFLTPFQPEPPVT